MLEIKKDRLQGLAEKWLKGTISKPEQQEFDEWFNQINQEQLEIGESRSGYRDHLFARIKQETGILLPKPVKLWPKIAAVAAVLACIAYGIYCFNSLYNDPVYEPHYANDITPGRIGATLTLASGKRIRLTEASNGELAREAQTSVTKTANGHIVYEEISSLPNEAQQFNTLSTEKSETYQVKLPDGSTAMLNASSSLVYPTSFNKLKNRSVELHGEAYFEITKDKSHPFIVKNGAQDVEVLGTHFNLSTYANEPAITTLEEGSVKVSTVNSSTVIRPGEQVINNGGPLMVEDANVEEALAWKNGNFIFSGEGIRHIMRQLERWYNIEVIFEGSVTTEVFYANISRYKNISQVLKMLEKTKAVHFNIQGRRITVRE